MREDFFNFNRHDLDAACKAQGTSMVHVRQLLRHAYRDLSEYPWRHSGLPKKLQHYGDAHWTTGTFAKWQGWTSKYDGTTKFVGDLGDAKQIESVLIPEKSRLTLCVSSQVGCRQGCTFCHTGRMGKLRDLTAAEIVGQVVKANQWINENPDWLLGKFEGERSVSNVVFMGMGEPMDNVVNVVQAVRIMTDPLGLGIAPKRISVSTAGHLDGLRQFRKDLPRIPIAISLHQADNSKRSQVMPINRRWPVEEIVKEIKKINDETNNPVLIQYTVIHGVNDSVEDAQKLAALLMGLQVKVNLIPLNEIEPSRFASPSPNNLKSFRDTLHRDGVRVMIRYSKGQDIAAACGQLVS